MAEKDNKILEELQHQSRMLVVLESRVPPCLASDVAVLKSTVERNSEDLRSVKDTVFGLRGVQAQIAELRGRKKSPSQARSAWGRPAWVANVFTLVSPKVLMWTVTIVGLLGLALIAGLAWSGELGSTLSSFV